MAIQEYNLKLLKCEMITKRVKHFTGQIESSLPWPYIPGQFITIPFTHGDKIIRRSYSIANSPNGENTIEFSAGFVEGGPGTSFLFALKPSDNITITGPFGRLVLKEDESFTRLILIATSTGITPYRAMLEKLKAALEKNPKLEVVIIQGVAREEDILFASEFKTLADHYQNAKFIVCLSQEDPKEPYHMRGHVQVALEAIHPHFEKDMVYLCGNPLMIDETTELLKNKGFPIHQIIREKYLSR
jgi:ferredoxin-NADP reductase